MNTAHDSHWAEEEQHIGNMASHDLDFSNLLDLGEIDVAGFTLPDSSAPEQQQHAPYDENSTSVHDFANSGWDMHMDVDSSRAVHSSQNSIPDFSQHFDPQNWPQQNGAVDGQMGNLVYTQPQHIPPTPNSYELHAGDPLRSSMARQRQVFMNQQVQHQLHLNQTKRDTFTPLVSPAVTPQGTPFQHPHDFTTVPGAYFSPLSSPAIQAEHAQQHFSPGHLAHVNHHATQPSTAVNSTATSPVSNDYEMPAFGVDSAVSIPDRSRKSTRKTAAPRSIAQRVRQSPVVKAQKRKSAALSTSLSTQDLDNLLRDAQTHQSKPGALSTDGSTAESISPEPLTDLVMGPPPRPGTGSAHQSPTLYGQVPGQQQLRMKPNGGPATPASLMSIDNPSRPGSSTPLAASGHTHPLANVDTLDSFELPPAADNRPAPTNHGPRLVPARKTPKLAALATTTNGRPAPVLISPAISSGGSPSTPMTQNGRGRNSKKRSSIGGSTNLVSPALRPKISPSIKPLLPEGSMLNDSQHALLLASKSNYTHLLEGTSLPGVSYPDSLSSGLTSKRTSHKIAEQGRRNRINEALKEMQSLLPSPALRGSTKSDKMDGIEGGADGTADEAGDVADEDKADAKSGGKDAKAAQSAAAAADAKAANSKAATVESAIEYIRALQQEQAALSEALKVKDGEMDELRRKLRAAELRLSSSAEGSPESVK